MEELTCCDCGETWQREIKRGAKPPRCSECADKWQKKRALDARKPPRKCEDCGSSLHPSANKRQRDGKLRCGPCGKKHKRKFKHCPECGEEVHGNYKYCERHRPGAVRQKLLKKQCPECGEPFIAKTIAQSYCTGPRDGPGSCQKKAERKRAKARGYKPPRFPMICHGCKTEFMGERRKRKPGIREHQYCTHECYSEHRKFAFRKQFSSRLDWRDCADCGNQFVSRNGRQCCNKCRSQAQNPKFVAGSCYECAKQFVGRWHPTWPCRYCSEECETKASRRKSRRSSGRGDLHRKRARRFGVAYEWVNRKRVFERDNYMCGICGERTDPDSEPCSPQYPTLDHILPMALGGGHTYANVQCACFECNWKKGDSAPTEPQQMQLGLYLVSQKNRGTPLKLAA